MTPKWTVESLMLADRKTLENVLRTGTAPDWEKTNGYIYNGWNHEPVARAISGEKFKKGFLKKADGKIHGYNEIVEQDHKGGRGEWKTRLRNGRPTHLGFFRSAFVKDERPQRLFQPYYQHLGHLDYAVPANKWKLTSFLSWVKDFAVLPNPGDHELILCKAYLQPIRGLNIFYCYFTLSNREPIKYQPW